MIMPLICFSLFFLFFSLFLRLLLLLLFSFFFFWFLWRKRNCMCVYVYVSVCMKLIFSKVLYHNGKSNLRHFFSYFLCYNYVMVPFFFVLFSPVTTLLPPPALPILSLNLFIPCAG